MEGAKDLSWWHDLAGDVVKIQLTRKLDGGRVTFIVDKENIEAAGGPYITMPEETKAMLVLFLCS